jgi:hypothetical protein
LPKSSVAKTDALPDERHRHLAMHEQREAFVEAVTSFLTQ